MPKNRHSPQVDPETLRIQWRGWLERMTKEIRDLLKKKQLFWELQKIAEENKEILSPGLFFDWMCKNYMVAASVTARRFVDHHSDSESLRIMLDQILKNPGIINRDSHNVLYGEDFKFISDRDFDRLVGEGVDVHSNVQIQSDINLIDHADSEAKKIRKFVNKKIAHFTNPEEYKQNPNLNELDKAIDDIFQLVGKYSLLLCGNLVEQPHLGNGWRAVLYKPWIKESEGVAEAQAAVVQAVADGELTPEEGSTITGILEARRKAIETQDHEGRISALEARKDKK